MNLKRCKKSAVLMSILLAVSILFSAGASALNQFLGYADYTATSGVPSPPEIESGAAIVIEVNSGTILYAKNAFTHYTAASTQKMLTALVALENSSLSDMVTFSSKAIEDIEDGGHNYDVVAGETMSMRSCLEIMLVASMNEAAYAIAEHISGSVEEFAKLMNQRAKECGARDSVFVTPNGLNGEGQYTNAYDMAMIIAECAKNPTLVELASLTECNVTDAAKRDDGYQYDSHNKILVPDSEFYREYVKFGKTGYTSKSKNTLVSFASKDGLDVVCVILRGPGAEATYTDTAALCEFVFKNVAVCDIGDMMHSALCQQVGECEAEFSNTNIILPKLCSLEQVSCSANVSKNEAGEAAGEILINMNGTTFTRSFTALVSVPVTAPGDDPAGGDEPSSGVEDTPPPVTAPPVTTQPVTPPETPTVEEPILAGEVTGNEKTGNILRWVIIAAVIIAVLVAVYLLLVYLVDRQVKKRASAYDMRYAQWRAQRESRK